MKSNLFYLRGIVEPGRVNLFQIGTVNLSDLGDDQLMEIYKKGNCPFIELTPEGFKKLHPEMSTIEVRDLNPVPAKNASAKKKTVKKK